MVVLARSWQRRKTSVTSRRHGLCEEIALPAQHGASAEAVPTPCARAQQPMPSPTYELTSAADALVVKVDLPDVKKASEVDLNISATRLHLIVPPPELKSRCARFQVF